MRISPRPFAHVAVVWGSWVKYNCPICFLKGVPRPIRGLHQNSRQVLVKTFQVLRLRLQAGSGSLCGFWKRLDRRYPQPFRPAYRPFVMAGTTLTVTFACVWERESPWFSLGCVCC